MNGGCDAHKADNEKRLNVRENEKKKLLTFSPLSDGK